MLKIVDNSAEGERTRGPAYAKLGLKKPHEEGNSRAAAHDQPQLNGGKQMKDKLSFTRRDALRLAAIGGASAATGSLALPHVARAQAYPSRPLNIVVPFAAGGYNDRLARAFAPYLQKEFGQPMVVVNRPGAGTQLGHTYYLQQPDDGHSILCTSAAPYIPLTILLQNAPYKREDFQMLNLPSRDYTVAATSSGGKVQSFAQAIDMLKKDPTSLSIGVQPASADYANLMLSMRAAGVDTSKLRLVTYDGGGPARNATAGSQVDIGFVGGEGFLPLKSRVRPLAMFAEQPVSWWPDAPLASAAGIQNDMVVGSQSGWVFSSKIREEKPDLYKTLLGAVERASKNPEAVAALEKQELSTEWFGPEESQKAYLSTFDVMAKHLSLLKAS